ncbi:GrpB family protein [Neobacillus mesonae]|uniref:GrpB family protein n=1 Tax=Neobacillus mesonae TaxID=1193713 RepID=A0A3T0I6R7_9BACI|nr:GrpB family protein [Neobacillus mesonae]AZU65026.1 GrpB family protein [Neobacillus mesonae]
MNLGLKNDEVNIVPFSEEWIKEFSRVRKEIHQSTNISEDRIVHIGSTAIKGMMAKPILDILVAVDDLTTVDISIINGLKSIGFLRLRVQRPNEIVFAKFADQTYQVKTHYIHLVEFEKELWKDLIFFRDYLNANEKSREEYLNLKLDYIKKHSTGVNAYTDHKEKFVKSIFKKRTGQKK